MISIIIPLYNVENYVVQCLDSFEKQLYKNFELIIVNDGSTDKSAYVVREYMEKSNMNIKLIEQNNSGVSAARNKGLDLASGEYICFVDPDDMVRPEYLSVMINILHNNSCDLVICGSKKVSEDWNPNDATYEKHPVEIMDSLTALRKFLYGEIVSGVCFLMVKRELIENNKLRFADGYRYSEDLEMMWKMLAHSKTIAYTKSQLYIYRTRSGSAMSIVDEKRIDGFNLMVELENYFQRVRPDFFEEFKRYGVARWVWATLWQVAIASKDYKSFVDFANKFKPKMYIKKLVTYPKAYVALSSLLYCLSPLLYYDIIQIFGKRRIMNRLVVSSDSNTR